MTTFTLPEREAIISGVTPLLCTAFAFAPAASSFSTMAAFAFSHARIERGHAVVVGRVDLGAGAQQPVDRVQVVPVRRPQQRRDAVGPRRVDIDAFFQQRPHGVLIALRDGVDQPEVWTGGGGQAGQRREQKPYQARPDMPFLCASSFLLAFRALPRDSSPEAS